jgi:hypothetical protein
VNCRATRSLISAYIDSELTGEQMLSIRRHLSDCDECRAEHHRFVSVKRLLSRLPDQDPPAYLVENLHHVASRESADPIARFFWLGRPLSVAQPIGSGLIQSRRLAVACMLTLVGAWFIVGPSSSVTVSEQAAAPGQPAGMATVRQRPLLLTSWRDTTLNPPVVDAIDQPVALQDDPLPAFEARMFGRTRRERDDLLTIPVGYPVSAQAPAVGLAPSNIVDTAFSTPSH